MAILNYRDFVLFTDPEAIQRNQYGEIVAFSVLVLDSPVGQGEKSETVDVPADLNQICSLLEKRMLDEDLGGQIGLGQTLADLLLPPYARSRYRESRASLSVREGLRLRLRLADPLSAYPWEFLHLQETRGEPVTSDFLALDPRVSIVRHEPLPMPGDWSPAPARRRIVVAMASPEGHPRLPHLVQEQRALKAELDKVDGLTAVYLPHVYEKDPEGALASATPVQIEEALRPGADIFHFSGHGEFSKEQGPVFDTAVGTGSILLADESNRPWPIPAGQLAEMLRGKEVRLVVLGSCETVQTGSRPGSHTWGGIAVSLLRAGIPAVLGMQYRINDRLAAAFLGVFYQAVVAGYLIDEAVALGRLAIRREITRPGSHYPPHVRDWAVPVLYLRSEGGQVFAPVNDASAREQAEQRFADQVRIDVQSLAEDQVIVGAIDPASAQVAIKVREEARSPVVGIVSDREPEGALHAQISVDTAHAPVVGVSHGTPKDTREALDELRSLGRSPSAVGTSGASPQKETAPPPGSACPGCGQKTLPEYNVCAFCGLKLRS
jgi:hypothetical protein